ncbi:MAG TPA: 3'-5' exonuclease [Anaeromyxobacter sp.]
MLFASPPWDSVFYWALDLETGGLDAARDPILAVGMVPVRAGRIRLGEAYRTLVRPGARPIDPASIRAHQLVSGEFRDAPPIEDVLPEITRRLYGSALIVHQKGIDVAFLQEACRRTGLRWPAPKVIDTVELLLRRAKQSRFRTPELPLETPALMLSLARDAHGLPPYQAHDALTDAIATAELFLVLRHELRARTLRDLR